MTKPPHLATRHPPLRFERNLAMIFALLGILMTTLISVHWFLVLEPALRRDAESHSRILAQAQAGSIEQLLINSRPKLLRRELETTLDQLLLLRDLATGQPFIRRITLLMDEEQPDDPADSLSMTRGAEHCPECFVSEIPLYHADDRQLIGIATFHASPRFIQSMVSNIRLQLLWVGGSMLCFIGFAWFGVGRLLTERLKTEQALNVAFAKYRTLFDAFPLGITVTDAAGQIIETNLASEHLLGLDQEDVLKRRIDDPQWLTLRPDGSPMPAEEYPALQTLARGTVIRDREMGLTLPNGEVRWLGTTAAPLPVEGLGAVVVFEDITPRKQAQAAREAEATLRESERRFRIMTDELPLIVWVQDTTNSTAFVNKTCCEYFAVLEKDLVRQGWRRLVHADDRKRFFRSFAASYTARKPFHDQCRMRRADGEWRWLESFARPIHGTDGSFSGIVGTSLDITERKAADEALMESHRELERRAGQLGRLTSQLTLAEQRERERLANVIHDHLQQLLVAAAFGVERLDRRLSSQPADSGAQDALSSVKDLLDQAIGAARTLVADLSPPILQDGGLPEALEWLARTMRKRYDLNVELSLDSSASPRRDDVRSIVFESVREALFNIVKHARCTHARLTLERQDDRQLRIVIEDHGVGFETDRPRPEDSTESGFGLLSMHERLHFLGGACVIESTPGRGTRVILTAPLEAGIDVETVGSDAGLHSTPQSSAPVAASNGCGAPLRVLLVDDHTMMRQGLSMMLADEPDITVVGEASNGLEAIGQMQRLTPDLVLMDYSMPRMDGIEATRRIKAQWPGTRIIGLSMYDEADRAAAMIQAGASAYVAKASGTDALLKTIRLEI